MMKKVTIPKYMLKGSGSFRSKWDFLIIVLAIYNSFSIPLKLAFNPYVLNQNGFLALDATVDLVFMIDIIFTFRTTYLDPKMGEEVVDPLLIAAEYMSFSLDKVFEGGSFYLDLISSLPLNDLI